ncbi:lipopolysaccharide biosynthesis protein [Clostridium perfringens]|uniref:lipopolysaccharide biosynthesis protein n=1 Tax=Clostridium perfringens TaxID=1502 RepID=UPI0022E104EC|nr:lipopolysaccharide biosynthesis protein [Clostridium perfringens]MDU6895284.1 lipopolysaccharide biosynthesis protein [Clostridium perfringens]MDU6932585.1 lipopolysaccharide biosynthesis protein [Clostridium perfringens]
MSENRALQEKVVSATKWSAITEIAAKLVSPITNMILARVLVPEAFGVVATITMIISFADMFTDAGFQKYLVQYEFEDYNEQEKSINVAFWTNLIISLFIWGVICVLKDRIAIIVGNPGLGIVIAVACVQLPITSFSSIQMAVFKRKFDFKTLFFVRIVSILIPFFITIPLAFNGFSYWALIIGTIVGQLSNAIILTIKSNWKPRLFYDFKVLRKMFSFSIWSLGEAISIWLSSWIDILIIGSVLDEYHLGLYRTSITTVNVIFSLVTSTVTPILFSTLSRLQSDNEKFKSVFYKNQKLTAYLIFPMGVGMYLFSDTVTSITLGNQWSEASDIIGIWAITTAIKIIFSDFNSECYRAKGRPRLSLIVQLLHIVVLIPACLISVSFGFKTLVYTRALIRGQLMLVSLLVMQFVINIPIREMIRQVIKPAVFTIIMAVIAILLKVFFYGIVGEFISIVSCIVIYILLIIMFAKEDLKSFNKFIPINIFK